MNTNMVLDMLQTAGSCTWEYLSPFLTAGIIMIMRVPKEVDVLVEEREQVLDRIRKAEDRVAAAGDGEGRELLKRKAKQLRIIDFCIEDVIDEWNCCLQHERMNERISMKAIEENMTHEEWEHSGRCVALPCQSANKFVSIRCCDRLQIALKIKNIKSDLDEIEDSEQQDPNVDEEEREERERKEKEKKLNSRKNPDKEWKNLQRQPYKAQTEIMGFEADSKKIIDWLEDGSTEYNVTVLVGMAGQGKTALAKQIFDNEEVIGKFTCKAWINVSDFSDIKEFFRFMLEQFYQEPTSPPTGYLTMGLASLKNEVKKYLHKKRCVFFFDDVWNKKFWQEIEQTVSDNNENGSRIIITTRSKEVARTCENSTIVEVQPLSSKESEKMFCRIAFQVDIDNESCPRKYAKSASEIVEICDGLPLGIVAIGKLVSHRKEYIDNWKSRLGEAGVTKIFCLGFDNLPHYLKKCLLYFGIYPQGYTVKTKRLIRQWIAEGFVRYEMGRRVEEVAEDYLTSLIDRNLVLVSSFTIDGKPKGCRVHYLVHHMILTKFEDLLFCHCINEDNRSNEIEITRRLSIAANSAEKVHVLSDSLENVNEGSFVRSLHFFSKKESSKQLETKIPSRFKQLKVLDSEKSQLSYNLENLGDFIHLKYLSFRETNIQCLPKSIDKLVNLETLDVRQTAVNEMPKEVGRLRNLRHLLGLVELKVAFGGMESLQTLRTVKLDDNVGQIEKELGKSWQIKDLGLSNVEKKHGNALCSVINEMEQLEKLRIAAKSDNGVIDFQLERFDKLQKLCLQGKLLRWPFVNNFDGLSKLVLSGSKLTNESKPLDSLKILPKLLFLCIINEAYVGESLNFEDAFAGLEELVLGYLNDLTFITAHTTALPSLKKLWLRDIPQLKTLPFSIQHLENLDHLNYQNMSLEFKRSIASYGGRECAADHQACVPCRNKWSAKFVNE